MLFDDKSKGIAQAYLSMLEAKKQETKMDPVGKHDADIDNDGDTDKSDEYLIKRRKAIATSMKKEETEQVDEASCGTKPKKEAIEITIGGKSEVSKKGMKDKEGGDDDESEDDSEDDSEDGEVEIKKKDSKSDDKKTAMKKEAVKNPYAIGMATAMKSAKDKPPLEKSTITKAHKIAKSIMKKESTVWNWDEILEASDEELDALIEQLEGEDLQSFMAEFSELSEATEAAYKKSPHDVDPKEQEKLEPRAPAEKAFADLHKGVVKDHPFDKNQHDQGVNKQAPVRPGDKRVSAPMKSLKDIRK